MIIRQPVEFKKECFGLEYNLDDLTCKKCPFQKECSQYMGSRLEKVPLNQAKFLPSDVTGETNYKLIDEHTVITDYVKNYFWVFGEKPRDKLSVDDATLLIKNAKDLMVHPKLFMLSAFYAHQNTGIPRAYYAADLKKESTLRAVDVYRVAASKKFGTYDVTSLMRLVGDPDRSVRQDIYESELLAATWIVNIKRKKSGDPVPYLFSQKEMVLKPIWLAIEPKYEEFVLRPFFNGQDNPSRIQRDQRVSVVETRKVLKKSRALERTIGIRASVIPLVIDTVLGNYGHGHTAQDFVVNREITDVLKFWSRLGLAMQQVDCLKLVNERL